MSAGLAWWSEAAQWLVLVILAAFAAGLTYLVADLHRRLGPDQGAMVPDDGLEIGEAAPTFETTDKRTGQPVTTEGLAGRPYVLAFLSPECRPCVQLIPPLNRLADRSSGPRLVVVALDGRGVDYAIELRRSIQVVGDPGQTLQAAFRVQRAPLVYVVDADGVIALRVVANAQVDLEDAFDGVAHAQGASAWTPLASNAGGGDLDGDDRVAPRDTGA